jgi:glyoxylase-like metal-dependent hydrolase (beta-lactamase superfamily II)
VLVSHGHADHFSGGVRADGRPLFPNARYWMQRSEWQHWLSADSPEPDHAATFRKTLLPLEDCFSLAEGEQEIVPGIRCRPTPGHSPGHMAIEIGGAATYTGDVLLSPPNVEHPAWVTDFDVWPEQVVASRRALLAELGESGALVLTCHFPGSGAGRVVRDRGGDGWRWQPEELG